MSHLHDRWRHCAPLAFAQMAQPMSK
jgi:hypothetical protein